MLARTAFTVLISYLQMSLNPTCSLTSGFSSSLLDFFTSLMWIRGIYRHTACFPLISPTEQCSSGCRQLLLPHQDPAEREVQSAGLVLTFPGKGGGGWTDVCPGGLWGRNLWSQPNIKKPRVQIKGCFFHQHEGKEIQKMWVQQSQNGGPAVQPGRGMNYMFQEVWENWWPWYSVKTRSSEKEGIPVL